MNNEIFFVLIGFLGTILGALITSIGTWFHYSNEQKKWGIERKIIYFKDKISELKQQKKDIISTYKELLSKNEIDVEKATEAMSYPQEVLDVIHNFLKNSPHDSKKKQQLIWEIADKMQKEIYKYSNKLEKIIQTD